MRADVYQTVTDQIITELEKGVRPWGGHGAQATWKATLFCRCAITALPIAA
jgi:antirestriction protein ArdC